MSALPAGPKSLLLRVCVCVHRTSCINAKMCSMSAASLAARAVAALLMRKRSPSPTQERNSAWHDPHTQQAHERGCSNEIARTWPALSSLLARVSVCCLPQSLTWICSRRGLTN